MASPRGTPTKGVTYINHFPKFFLVPYGEPLGITEEQFQKRLSASNCELLVRPKVGLSEICETLEKNLTFTEDDCLDANVRAKIAKRFEKLTSVVRKFQTKNGQGNGTGKDLKVILKETTRNAKLLDISQQLYILGHKMFSVGLHYMVANYLLKDPAVFAKKSNLLSRKDSILKMEPTVDNLLSLLKEEVVQTPSTPMATVKRNLSAALESTDDESDVTLVPEKANAETIERKKRKKYKNVTMDD